MLSFLLIEIITVQSVPAGGMFQSAVFDHETLIDEIYGKLNSAWQTGRCNKDIAYRTLVKKKNACTAGCQEFSAVQKPCKLKQCHQHLPLNNSKANSLHVLALTTQQNYEPVYQLLSYVTRWEKVVSKLLQP